MSTGGIVLAVIFVVVTLVVIAAPFFRGNDRSVKNGQLESLSAHYERVLTNIRDLDEDLALGKIQQSFYDEQRAVYVAEGVNLLKQIDTLQPEQTVDVPGKPPASQADASAEEFDDMIEQAIAAKRKDRQVS